jgi:cytosine/adenosine deaminase-related metal-dependent hydrolase/C-terminal processing protease CtpA/Prc
MGPLGTIPRGAIYIVGAEIKAVQKAADPRPGGFEDAPAVNTGDTIYPGLIELHNHLSYNAMPLWDVPKKYTNNAQWKTHDDYRRLITKPSQVLGRTEGVVEALVRFVECRCLLGGVTTSQGITLSSAGGIGAYYQGIVRNVEQTRDPGLPDAGTRIANPDAGGAREYLDRLAGHTCYLQHLGEGVDRTARLWFQRLQLESGDWAITNSLCGIHSTALNADDLKIVSQRGGSMVWSPLSNFLLYGSTLDIKGAKEAQILMGIGCDWGPSGSKNLLGEMKVAWITSQEQGGVFTPREIVAMATVNAAKILKWDSAIGSIEPGKRADLVCVNGQQGDDFMRLIEARETSISLVIIDGVARVGQRRLMEAFGPGTEEIKVGRSARVVNLAQATSHPLVGNLSLAEATRRLQNAMADLPQLALNLDAAAGSGLFSGSTDNMGISWRVVPDFEAEDQLLEDELGMAGLPLADFVQPMLLERITAVDDTVFLKKLVAARNLPEYVKRELPGLYGMSLPIPESAGFLRASPEPLAPQVRNTLDLKTVLRVSGELSLDDRKTIVNQALILLESNYVHLPLKRAMHAVDPVQRLKLLHYRLEEEREEELSPEIEFHNEMSRIFNSLRDLHTTYLLPSPFRQKTAWLPFLIEEFWERGEHRYLVTRLVSDAGPAEFQVGVEVLHWNGTPIHKVVSQNAERQAGSNLAARHARGLNSLTLRPLSRGLPPDEEWVTLRYRDLAGQEREWTQEWLVFEPGTGIRSPDPDSDTTAATAIGLDVQTDDVQEAKKVLFASRVFLEEIRAIQEDAPQAISNADDGPSTFLPTVFRARRVTTEHGTYGHIRIFTFNIGDAEEFVQEFIRLVEELPQDGLIIDVRGNPGGLIYAAERLLQVLTPRHIEPQKAQFINSPVNLQICKNYREPSSRFPGFSLGDWIPSIAQSVETGATYSLGYSITPEAICNDIGQRYDGPKVLITDALCYSATDIFVAGFQDHRIGTVLGISENTGAGGANVWSHRLLRVLMESTVGPDEAVPSPYAPLPKGADLRVAVRRTVRVGPNAGSVVEDLGVMPDAVHLMTRNDILNGNQDLINQAAQILAGQRLYSMKVDFEDPAGALATVRVETRNVDWVNVIVNDRPRGSRDVIDEFASIDLQEAAGDEPGDEFRIEIQGYEGNQLVAARRARMARG